MVHRPDEGLDIFHNTEPLPLRRRPWLWVLWIAVLLLIAIVPVAFLVYVQGPPPTPTPVTVPVSTVPPATDLLRPVLLTEFGPGMWLVGGQIAPGTYHTDGSTDDRGHCYWARHSGQRGMLNDDRLAEGAATVVVKDKDALFETLGNCHWRKVN